jgi:hypothetical protein
MLLTREQIEAREQRYRDIPVPEWNGDVRIVPMSAADLQVFLKAKENGDMARAGVQVLARVMVGEDGERLYSDKDVEKLYSLPGTAAVMATLLPEILEFSGVDKARQGELAKKSASPSNGSSID